MTAIAIKPAHFPWFDYSRYSFSLGLKTPAGVYLSGHTASEYDPVAKRIVVRGGMIEQVRTAWTKIGAILDAAGLGFENVVRVVEYLRLEGIERYVEAAAARQEVFGAHQPVVNTVPVRSLLRPEAFIEIEVTAELRIGQRESSGIVFLPTVQPVDEHGRIIGAGDVVAQTEAIFERAGQMLAALGLGFDRVVKTVDYTTPAALAATKAPVARAVQRLGPVHPVPCGYSHATPAASRGADSIRLHRRPRHSRRGQSGWTRYQKLTYSPAARAGKLLFMSGRERSTRRPSAWYSKTTSWRRPSTPTRTCLRWWRRRGWLQHLVKTIEYVTPAALERYRSVAGVRSKLLREPWPASTGLVCKALLRPEMLIEVDPFGILD